MDSHPVGQQQILGYARLVVKKPLSISSLKP